MKKFKHYSFDLWMTLIRSNPEFKPARVKYFATYHNPKMLSNDEITAIIKDVDLMCNYTNEVVGGNISAEEMYAMVLHKMGNGFYGWEAIKLIYKETEALFMKHMPVMYDNDTLSVLQELNKRGCKMSITSNTGFIEGKTIRKFLAKAGIHQLFNGKFIFSDETGHSKPNNNIFFQLIMTSAHRQEEIIHIGDNIIADIEGGKSAGLETFQINSNDKTIKDILW